LLIFCIYIYIYIYIIFLEFAAVLCSVNPLLIFCNFFYNNCLFWNSPLSCVASLPLLIFCKEWVRVRGAPCAGGACAGGVFGACLWRLCFVATRAHDARCASQMHTHQECKRVRL
jgi:hypothetical protein